MAPWKPGSGPPAKDARFLQSVWSFYELRRYLRILAQHLVIRVVLLVVVTWVAVLAMRLPLRPSHLVALALTTPSTGFILDSLNSLGVSDHERAWCASTWSRSTAGIRSGSRFAAAPGSGCRSPTPVFTLVIVEILRDRFGVPQALFGGLIVYTLANTLLPGFILRNPETRLHQDTLSGMFSNMPLKSRLKRTSPWASDAERECAQATYMTESRLPTWLAVAAKRESSWLSAARLT